MGAAAPRIDGRLKVTGRAQYPADIRIDNPAYAVLVTSAIAKGRIRRLDVDAAQAVPGVLDILTHENFPRVQDLPFHKVASTIRPLASPEIRHDGQIIAVVVAETFEAAREAAYKVEASYDEEEPAAGFDSPGAETQSAAEAEDDESVDLKAGDVDKALAVAAVTIDALYETPTQHHNPIELFSTTCAWQGDRLTVYEPSQFVYGVKHGIAKQLEIDPKNVRVISSYVGGAFGSKGSFTQRTALIAVAAKRLGRPVKLVATRDQGFTIGTYRAETRHHIRLGARNDGKLVAYTHEGWEVTSRPDTYYVGGTDSTARLYAYGAVQTKLNVVRADRNTPGWMRAPAEFPYVYALECAMDELAVEIGMDPVALRRVNDTMTDPVSGKSYSSRSVMRCYDEAARAFGWAGRKPDPRAMRDGDWLVGWGCASTAYPTHMSPATVRIHLTADGEARVEVAATTSAPAPIRSWPSRPPSGSVSIWPPSRSCSATPICRPVPTRADRTPRPASARWSSRLATASAPSCSARRPALTAAHWRASRQRSSISRTAGSSAPMARRKPSRAPSASSAAA
jgi:xanthine dehydrogenase YagR molybdenum-binding subunit